MERLAGALDAWLRTGTVGKPGSTANCGPEWQAKARRVLHKQGVSLPITGDSSASPKMLRAMESYGLLSARETVGLTHAETRRRASAAGALTEAGRKLVEAYRAGDEKAFSDCCASALALRSVPSPLEPGWAGASVSPIGLTAAVLLALEPLVGDEAVLTRAEMAVCLQVFGGDADPAELARRVLEFRQSRMTARNLRARKDAVLKKSAKDSGCRVKPDTLEDYADCVFNRYVETGIFEIVGKLKVLRLAAGFEARAKASRLASLQSPASALDDPSSYLERLEAGAYSWKGRTAPASRKLSERVKARETIDALASISSRGRKGRVATSVPLVLERERIAAASPWSDWPQVRELLAELERSPRRDDELVARAAALEWCLFRAMLLFAGPQGVETPIHEARRFAIASDLKPVIHAPGRGAEVEFRCVGGMLLAGEATLLGAGIRQIEKEIEPVKRHVAELPSRLGSGRPYGLLIAPGFDMNVVMALRDPRHWKGRDQRQCDVVPLTLGQVVQLGNAAAVARGGSPKWLETFMRDCLQGRSGGEAEWMAHVAASVRRAARAVIRPSASPQPKGVRADGKTAGQSNFFEILAA
jgi:hypothetical protein